MAISFEEATNPRYRDQSARALADAAYMPLSGSSSSGGGSVRVNTNVSPAPSRGDTLPQPTNQLPPEPPKRQAFSYGPKSGNVSLVSLGSAVEASDANPGVVFYRYGIEPQTGCKVYWEIGLDGGDCGAGVGFALTATDSEPGKDVNPGAMLYYVGGSASVFVNGSETALGALAAPERVGVGVELTGTGAMTVRWYFDGAQVGGAFSVTFAGKIWVPCLCTLDDTAQFTLEDAAL